MPETTAYNVFRGVFIYSAFIIFAPISSFFISKYFFFEGIIGATDLTSNVWSAIVAVVVLHIALGMFIQRAWWTDAEKSGKVEDKID